MNRKVNIELPAVRTLIQASLQHLPEGFIDDVVAVWQYLQEGGDITRLAYQERLQLWRDQAQGRIATLNSRIAIERSGRLSRYTTRERNFHKERRLTLELLSWRVLSNVLWLFRRPLSYAQQTKLAR